MSVDKKTFIGIDLGGTKVNIGLVKNNKIIKSIKEKLPLNQKDEWDVINLIISITKKLSIGEKIDGIGIGVPSILDKKKGIIHEVQNIPTWKQVPLASILKKEFDVPVFIDNDANCFALGELYFGQGKGCQNFVGLTLGTGMGSGIITNGKLMTDANGGSGEFGMIPYKNGVIEDYCSGKFFKNILKINGEEVYKSAKIGCEKSIKIYESFGEHLGNAIQVILYSIDPNKIIIGGSIVKSSDYFDAALKKNLQSFSYKSSLENFEIIYSTTHDIAVLGAVSLCMQD